MDDPDVSAALEAASVDEESLLSYISKQQRVLERGELQEEARGERFPIGTTGEPVTTCCLCGGPVERAGALHEEGGPHLLAVWWCPDCRIAFDDAGIAAPKPGRAPLTPGFIWYGRWRFYLTV